MARRDTSSSPGRTSARGTQEGRRQPCVARPRHASTTVGAPPEARVNWDNVTLTIFAASGAGMLLLAQLRELLMKLTDVVRAWNEVRRSLQSSDAENGQPRD
jgi:hypothetical protein